MFSNSISGCMDSLTKVGNISFRQLNGNETGGAHDSQLVLQFEVIFPNDTNLTVGKLG